MQKTGITILAIIVIIICAGVVWYVMGSGSDQTNPNGVEADTQAVRDNIPDTVAVVNGEEISKQDFLALGEQMAAQQANQEVDITSSEMQLEISNQSLNLLVNQALLLQAAEQAGTEVSDSVDEQYAQLVQSAGGADAFQGQLDQANVTQEQIREDLRAQLLIQAHLDEELDVSGITVSDEEIQTLYDQVQAQQGEATPALEEVREQLAAQVRREKESQLVNEYLTGLRDGADIQVNI
jgi:peptidyl-prolyl cis-trans isomerase SurA